MRHKREGNVLHWKKEKELQKRQEEKGKVSSNNGTPASFRLCKIKNRKRGNAQVKVAEERGALCR